MNRLSNTSFCYLMSILFMSNTGSNWISRRKQYVIYRFTTTRGEVGYIYYIFLNISRFSICIFKRITYNYYEINTR